MQVIDHKENKKATKITGQRVFSGPVVFAYVSSTLLKECFVTEQQNETFPCQLAMIINT
jgi:hypothetical protein